MDNLEWAFKLLAEKAEGNFYGSVTFNFQDGKIHTSKQEQLLKPPIALSKK